jgi:hypothetical protein
MRNRLSSPNVLLYRLAIPALHLIVAAMLIHMLFIPGAQRWFTGFMIGFVGLSALTQLWLIELPDAVHEDGTALIVRRGGKDELIPFSAIAEVSEDFFFRPRRVTVRFKPEQYAGKPLRFIPAFDPGMLLPPFVSQVARDLRFFGGLSNTR